MLASTHAVTGAILISQITDPKFALLAAFISHPLLDLFPHWDFNTRWAKRSYKHTFIISAADAGLGYLLGFILFFNTVDPILLFAAMWIAQWTDWLEAPYHFGYKIPPFTWTKKLQHYWHTKLGWPWGFIPQLAIILFAVYLSVK